MYNVYVLILYLYLYLVFYINPAILSIVIKLYWSRSKYNPVSNPLHGAAILITARRSWALGSKSNDEFSIFPFFSRHGFSSWCIRVGFIALWTHNCIFYTSLLLFDINFLGEPKYEQRNVRSMSTSQTVTSQNIHFVHENFAEGHFVGGNFAEGHFTDNKVENIILRQNIFSIEKIYFSIETTFFL